MPEITQFEIAKAWNQWQRDPVFNALTQIAVEGFEETPSEPNVAHDVAQSERLEELALYAAELEPGLARALGLESFVGFIAAMVEIAAIDRLDVHEVVKDALKMQRGLNPVDLPE